MNDNHSPRVHLATLGDELLLGLYPNGHLQFLGEQLTRRGLPISSSCVIKDDPDEITRHFPAIWDSADIVITTGGLGPTSDDNTREAISKCLGLELEFDPYAEAEIKKRFQRLGRNVNDRQLKQCYKPVGSKLIPNRLGTAPGIYIKHQNKHLIMLPGPTHELRYMFDHELVPMLAKENLITETDAYIQLRICGVPEGQLEDVLSPLLGQHKGIGVAICAHKGLLDLRLSPGKTNLSMSELQFIANEAEVILGDNLVCIGNASLAEIVTDQLRAMEKTLAVAESCTGGILSTAFTEQPGASKTFMGGVCSYNTDTKIEILGIPECLIKQHGAVSEECAVAMATGVSEHFNSDYGLSITGYAGPDGGTPDNPVGTVYVGYHSPIGAWACKMVFQGDRGTVRARAANGALDLMRRKLQKYKLAEFICMEAGSV